MLGSGVVGAAVLGATRPFGTPDSIHYISVTKQALSTLISAQERSVSLMNDVNEVVIVKSPEIPLKIHKRTSEIDLTKETVVLRINE